METVLNIEHVSKRFGNTTAVSELSCKVESGTIYGFLGPNGAGKTTTIRMIMSIFYPDEGSITVLGSKNPERVKDRLGYLPEERGLYKKMRVGEILIYFGRLKGLKSKEARRRTSDLLERFNLGDWYKKPCEALSKGMSQKVQILATLIHDPDLVILDEPFAGLDPVNRDLMRDVILDLKRSGKTIIFSTHIMEQAEQICDAILLINRGRKVLEGPLTHVKSQFRQSIHLDYEGDGQLLRAIPGVQRINDSGKHAEIFLNDDMNPQDFLHYIIGKMTIRSFSIREPSLHEIFIQTVSTPENQEYHPNGEVQC